jgi:hypothetical protein
MQLDIIEDDIFVLIKLSFSELTIPIICIGHFFNITPFRSKILSNLKERIAHKISNNPIDEFSKY